METINKWMKYLSFRKITKKKMNIREQLEGQKNNLVQTKNQRLKVECDKPEYQPPCAGNQVSQCTKVKHSQ